MVTPGAGEEFVFPEAPKTWSFFVSGDFARSRTSGPGNSASSQSELAAGSFGVEHTFIREPTRELTLGLVGSRVEQESDLAGGALGNTRLEGELLAVYGSWFYENFYMDGLVALAEYRHRLNRKSGLGREQNRGSATTRVYGFETNVGYNFALGDTWVTGPFASGEMMFGEVGAFEEREFARTASRFSSQDFQSWAARLGWQVSTQRQIGRIGINPQARVAIEHSQISQSDITASLINSPLFRLSQQRLERVGRGEDFSLAVGKTTQSSTILSLGLGCEIDFFGLSQLILDFEAQFGDGSREAQYGSVRFNLPW